MAAISKFPCFLSLSSSHKLFLNHQQEQEYLLCWTSPQLTPRKSFRLCASSARKSRGSRKVKSNVELCNEIREFMLAVGLPEDHVPSMKDLLDHGRTDLANIVRRRGYKLLRDILSNSTKPEIDGSNIENSVAQGQDVSNGFTNIPTTGQDEKAKDMAVNSLSTEVSTALNHPAGSDIDPEDNSFVHGYVSVESSADSTLEEKTLFDAEQQDDEVKNLVEDTSLTTPSFYMEEHDEDVKLVVEDKSLSTPVYIVEQQDKEVFSLVEDSVSLSEVSNKDNCLGGSGVHPGLNTDDDTLMPMETLVDSSLKEKVSGDSNGQDEKVGNVAVDTVVPGNPSSGDYKNGINIVASNSGGGVHMPVNYATANSSLEEKVANFIQNGDLDDIEDESAVSEYPINRSDGAFSLNGSVLISEQDTPSVTVNHTQRRDQLSEGLVRSDLAKDLDVETSIGENQVDVNRLKFMLHQKELELSRLKDQIEKEKLALSALQAKAETEINRARKLISEKDAELHAAEEGLSGLVEVKVQYCGEGEIVEVTGSFNGWHHRIKLDPQPYASLADPAAVGSRISRLWSTMLWLYPGVYEIKFIVDGQWTIDPQTESVTKNGICNNILRVTTRS